MSCKTTRETEKLSFKERGGGAKVHKFLNFEKFSSDFFFNFFFNHSGKHCLIQEAEAGDCKFKDFLG